MSEETNYRPRSPDLSAFAAPPPPPRLSRLPSYPSSTYPAISAFSPRGSYDASPYFSPQTPQATSYFGAQPISQPPHTVSPATRVPSVPFIPQHTVQQQSHSLSHQQPNPYHIHQAEHISSVAAPSVPSPPYFVQPHTYIPDTFAQPTRADSTMAPTRTRAAMAESDGDYMPGQASAPDGHPIRPSAPASHNTASINISTKFPVARIKRIMQADENIGKVAQATPTAVAKALELFMIDFIAKTAECARVEGSRRVTATHLKQAVENDQTFDFLEDTVAGAPDENAGGSKKSRAKSEDSDDEMGGTVQRKKSRTKKSKSTASDESD